MHKPSDYCDHCGRVSSSDCLHFCDWTEMWLCEPCLLESQAHQDVDEDADLFELLFGNFNA